TPVIVERQRATERDRVKVTLGALLLLVMCPCTEFQAYSQTGRSLFRRCVIKVLWSKVLRCWG
ncbi:hypothetical protein BaRGS_00035360, partial [Batillaria attramentaria]